MEKQNITSISQVQALFAEHPILKGVLSEPIYLEFFATFLTLLQTNLSVMSGFCHFTAEDQAKQLVEIYGNQAHPDNFTIIAKAVNFPPSLLSLIMMASSVAVLQPVQELKY